jgi:predicted dehydrogenase
MEGEGSGEGQCRQVYVCLPLNDMSYSDLRLQTVPGDYPAIYENLAEAIKKGDQSVFKVSPEQAALNIRIIEAGFQSSKEGRYIDI